MDNIRKFWGLMVQKKGKKLFRDEIDNIRKFWGLMVQKKVKKKKEKIKINFFYFGTKFIILKTFGNLWGKKKVFKKKKKKKYIYI